MRKFCSVILAVSILLMAGFVLAGGNATSSEGKSTFTNLAVIGNTTAGVPGYIELTDNSTTTPTKWYLWVDSNGKLRLASGNVVGYDASPSVVTPWLSSSFASGEIVGSQS